MRLHLISFLAACALALGAGGCQSNPARVAPEKLKKQVQSHYELGLDALNKNNLPKAFEELLHANKLDPKRADVLDALGYAWRLRGNLKKSEEYYKRALAVHPAPRTHNNYGALLLAMDRPKEAEIEFRKALDDPSYNHPDFAEINLGDALLAQNRFKEAIAAYRQARLLNPYQEVSRLKEAAAYLKNGQPDFAQAMYETILRDSPGNRPAMEGLVALLRSRHRIEQARQQLRSFIRVSREPMDKAWAQQTLRAIEP